jgi:flagellum-specific ATP synthase
MTRRLAMTAQQLLAPVDLAKASPRRIGTLVAHEGIIL